MTKFTTVIISGGKSSRMGTDKALLEIGGKTMIEQIVAQTAGLGGDQIVITNRPERYAFLNLPMFVDVFPDKGALGGLYTAIHSASQPYTLTLACDMPFLNLPLLKHMLSLAPGFDAVIPHLSPLSRRERGAGGVRENPLPEAEPFRAIYSKACLDPIRRALDAGKMRVNSFFPDMRIRWVEENEIKQFDPELLTFMNCNTPEELEEVKKIWTQIYSDERR
ncbi:MAG: molybdenum cofactor guanylyltransferase [Chloroflexi bacterium]|nr:molybdenum cofactor guanylyltransferase [Chloroflexota bacterium]